MLRKWVHNKIDNLIFLIFSGYDGNKKWLFSTKQNIEGPEKVQPIKRTNIIKLEDNPKKSFKSYHQQSDIFHKEPDNSKNIKGIQGYKNASSAFTYTEPNQSSKANNGTYHLESDIFFTKSSNDKTKKPIRGGKINYESKIEPKKEKNKKIERKEFLRTYEEWDLGSKKSAKYKNEPHPDNGLVYDFSNKPVFMGKTEKKLMPEKMKETVPKIQRTKKLFLKKNNEDPGSSLVMK